MILGRTQFYQSQKLSQLICAHGRQQRLIPQAGQGGVLVQACASLLPFFLTQALNNTFSIRYLIFYDQLIIQVTKTLLSSKKKKKVCVCSLKGLLTIEFLLLTLDLGQMNSFMWKKQILLFPENKLKFIFVKVKLLFQVMN